MRTKIVTFVLHLLFYKSPKISFTKEEINDFNKIFDEAIHRDGLIEYTNKFPKQRFIQYISNNKNVLLHGSNNMSISAFEPRRQTLYNGKYIDAVFASKDGIWPLFYAVLDKQRLKGSIRNGCLRTSTGNKFYFFSVSKETYMNDPWTTGMIYFLPIESFEKASNGILCFDEWISKHTVKPIARLEVDLNDFYFKDKVTIHKPRESIMVTWLLYKLRNFIRIRKNRV